MAPGIPDIREQERTDKFASGLYERLVENGTLKIAGGKRIPDLQDVVELIMVKWGRHHVAFVISFVLTN